MSAPAMPDYFQTDTRGSAQISLEGQSFFLMVPATQQPLYGQRPGSKFYGNASVFKPVGREVQPRLQAGTPHPVEFQNAAFSGAGCLHPAHRHGTPLSIVGGKHEVPHRQHGDRTHDVNQQKASHNASSDAHGTSEVAATQGLRPHFHSVGQIPSVEIWASSTLVVIPHSLRIEVRACPRLAAHMARRNAQYNGDVPFTIRDFQPADFDALWRIDQTCFPPGISYSRAELKAYMRRRGSFTLVAVADSGLEPDQRSDFGKDKKYSLSVLSVQDAAVGFIVAETDNRGSGHIITIDVVADARRFGVGSLLLRAAEERLRASRCRAVELETAVDNVSALSFYKRHGYNVIQTFPRYYSNGVDALVLKKNLDLPQ